MKIKPTEYKNDYESIDDVTLSYIDIDLPPNCILTSIDFFFSFTVANTWYAIFRPEQTHDWEQPHLASVWSSEGLTHINRNVFIKTTSGKFHFQVYHSTGAAKDFFWSLGYLRSTMADQKVTKIKN